jgi:hypothetical protein
MLRDEIIYEASHKMARAIVAKGRASGPGKGRGSPAPAKGESRDCVLFTPRIPGGK